MQEAEVVAEETAQEGVAAPEEDPKVCHP